MTDVMLVSTAGWTISIVAIATALVIAIGWERSTRDRRGGRGADDDAGRRF